MKKQHSSKASAMALIAALALLPSTIGQAFAADSQETIVFLRHGEKPENGLGQLDCQGFNRALALPKVLEAKFGKPAAIFAPNPSFRKKDDGKSYDYVRPLATIEPSAIYFGLPVDTSYGFGEIDKLKEALERPDYRHATIVVAWEHHLIDALVKNLMTAHGGAEDPVPDWDGGDFDGLYVVTINWAADAPAGSAIQFAQDREGLDGQKADCPF